MFGFLVGAVLYGLTYGAVFPQISALANYGNVTLPEIWNLAPSLVVIFFVLLSVFLFYLIDQAGWQRKDKLDD
jgi:hypothetical protein